jgi:hypothetical protein
MRFVYSLRILSEKNFNFNKNLGVHGGAVFEALRYKPKVAGSIPDSVIGIFR